MFYCLITKKTKNINIYKDGIHWTSISLIPSLTFLYLSRASKIIKSNNIHWVVGFSDIYYGIIAQFLAKKFNIKCLIDSYDNYESYISWLYPLHFVWRYSLRKADLVTVAGESLAMLQSDLGLQNDPVIVPMSADPQFKPADKFKSRKKLGLPMNKLLIGYFGTIHKSRGTDILIDLIDKISINNNLCFVLSGQSKNPVPNKPNTIWLGYLKDSHMPSAINSMDIVLIVNQHSKFGDYSFPVKLYEALNCEKPVIAAATKSISWILSEHPEMLASPRDVDSFQKKIAEQIEQETIYKIKSTWELSCDIFENALIEHL